MSGCPTIFPACVFRLLVVCCVSSVVCDLLFPPLIIFAVCNSHQLELCFFLLTFALVAFFFISASLSVLASASAIASASASDSASASVSASGPASVAGSFSSSASASASDSASVSILASAPASASVFYFSFSCSSSFCFYYTPCLRPGPARLFLSRALGS